MGAGPVKLATHLMLANSPLVTPGPVASTCIARVLGNDLPPRHAENQTLINVRHIVSTEFKRRRTWVINRVISPQRLQQLRDVLRDEEVQVIPFESSAFLHLTLPDHTMEGLSLEDEHVAYLTNNNAGRNAAMDACTPYASKVVCPFDSNVFVPSDWVPCDSKEEVCIVPMARLATLTDAEADAVPAEPQLCFNVNSTLRFQNEVPYGVRPKMTLLDNLCYPRTKVWKLRSYLQHLSSHPCSLSGTPPKETELVYRLPDHVGDSLTLHDSVYRGMLRKQGVHQLVRSAWDEALRPMIGRPLFMDKRRLKALRARSEYADQLRSLHVLAKRLVVRPVVPPLSALYMSPRPRPNQVAWGMAELSEAFDGEDTGQKGDQEVFTKGDFEARDRLHAMFDNVTLLAMAGEATGEVSYSAKAMEWLRTWFINPQTRLLPTACGAQSRRVRMRGRTRTRRMQKPSECSTPDGTMRESMGSGLIEFLQLYYLLDASLLLVDAGVMSTGDHAQMRLWVAELLASLRKEKYADLEWKRKNHHGLLLRLTMLALANYVQDKEVTTTILYEFNSLLAEQTHSANTSAGVYHLELPRADCRHYVALTSHAWLLVLAMTRHLGVAINEQGICKAVYTNMVERSRCNTSATTQPNMKTREIMLVNSWRHSCAMSVNLAGRHDVSGAIMPRMISRGHGVAPFWNLVSAV